MKWRIFVCAVVLLFVITGSVVAQTSKNTVALNGYLLNDMGEAAQGAHTVVITVYDGSGEFASPMFAEKHQVIVDETGKYNIVIGQGANPLTDTPSEGIPYEVFESDTAFIGIKIDLDAEMTPRYKLGAAPFALNAQYFDHFSTRDLARYSEGNVYEGEQIFAGEVTMNNELYFEGNSEFIGEVNFMGDVDLSGTNNFNNKVTFDGDIYVNSVNLEDIFVNTAGDTMTGKLFLPDDGLVVGTNRFVVGANVGINNDAPLERLDIVDSSGYGAARISNTSNALIGNIRYNPTDRKFQGYNGTMWLNFGGEWYINGSSVYWTAGNIGIGTDSPTARLQVIDQGSETVDQSQTSIRYMGSMTSAWQSFRAGRTGILTRVRLYMRSTSSSATCTVRIYTGTGTGGTILGSYSRTITSSTTWYDFTSLNAPVTNGSTYTIYVYSSTFYWYLNTNSYPYGYTYPYGTSYDFCFYTYVRPKATVMFVGRSSLGVNTENPNPNYALDVSGRAYLRYGYSSSDIRFKKNVRTLDNALDKVLKLNGCFFDWRTNEYADKNFNRDTDIGFIAQEVEKIIPELVSTDTEGYKSLFYPQFTALLIEATKEQQKLIEKLSSEQTDLDVLYKSALEETEKLADAINRMNERNDELKRLASKVRD
ncbi:MAG: tail fiber domain-containing protein [Planctomycetes bacterium]|nr:tail fiber domain-containing protein [Planctomycetota bacterium]